ncbi:TPA: hypothetical protein P0E31_001214 [Vibrio campbellii]|nr:hypothetical protein [Vibrio campbellii]
MSDKNIVLPSGLAPFKDVLQSYSYGEEATKREMAVICALEIIRVNSVGAPNHKVEEHLEKLGTYADFIQEALKK